MNRGRIYKNPSKNADYEFVATAAEKAFPKIINDGIDNLEVNSCDPLHAVDLKKINLFQTEFREFATVLVDESKNAQKFTWFPKATKFFLKRCLDRKEKFRASKLEKGFWTEILEEMHSAGFHVKNEEILLHKFKNLKRNYRIYNDKHKIRKGSERIIWPYFHILKELFSNGCAVNSPRRASIFEEDTTPSTSTLTYDTKKIKRMNTLQYLRRKLQRIKEKKSDMADKIRETLKETNRLQEERNNLILECKFKIKTPN